MINSDPYEVLMVHRNATKQEVRAAFKTLISQWHPDVTTSPEAHHRSATIIQAYRALSQPDRRSCVDRRSRNTSASTAPISPMNERRRGERRGSRSRQLSQVWRMAALAWVAIAGMTVVAAIAAELPDGQIDEIRLSSSQF